MDHLQSSRDIGKPVKIWTDEGHKIYGTLHSFNLSLGKVTLRDAYQMEKKAGVWSKLPFNGLQQFLRSEFRSVELVSRPENKCSLPELNNHRSEEYSRSVTQTRNPKPSVFNKRNYSKSKDNYSGDLNMKGATNQEDDSSGDFIKNQKSLPIVLPPVEQGINEKSFSEFYGKFMDNMTEWNNLISIERFTIKQLLWKDPQVCPSLKVAQHLYIIEAIDGYFRKAIQHINDQTKIGVSFECEGLGRTARLCWVTISTAQCVFMFDILSAGDVAFSMGLKQILENKLILKILHDSRTDSDLLYHKHSVNFVNVFDTMMADLIFLSKYVYDGNLPMHPRSLNHLLMDYLCIRHESLFFPRQRKGLSEMDTRKWSARPLPPMLVIGAVRRCLYLPALQEICLLALQYEMNQLTHQLLSVNRDANQVIAVKRSERPEYDIPDELLPNLNALRIKSDLFNQYRHENHSTLSVTTKLKDPRRCGKTFNGIRAEKDRSFQAGDGKTTTEKVVFNNIGPIDKAIVFGKDCIRSRKRYVSEEPNFAPIKLY